MMPMGIDNLILINDEARLAAYQTSRRGGGGVDSKQESEGKEKKFKIGEVEFEALMRSLDNMVSL